MEYLHWRPAASALHPGHSSPVGDSHRELDRILYSERSPGTPFRCGRDPPAHSVRQNVTYKDTVARPRSYLQGAGCEWALQSLSGPARSPRDRILLLESQKTLLVVS